MTAPPPPQLAPPPDPGPTTPVDVFPEDYYRVAKELLDGQQQVERLYTALDDRLQGLTGAAGNDNPAQKFAESYTPAVRSIYEGLVRLHDVIGAISQGLAQAGENHRRADAEAAGNDPGPAFPELVSGVCLAVQDPPRILGEGDTNIKNTIYDFVAPYYPDAHLDNMMSIHTEFGRVRDRLDSIAGDLRTRLISLADNNQAEDLDALKSFWERIDGGENTLFASLKKACDVLSRACLDYHFSVQEARIEIDDIVQQVTGELTLAGLGWVITILLTRGAGAGGIRGIGGAGQAILDRAAVRIAAVAARLLTTVSGAVALHATAEATGAMVAAIKNTPNPNVGKGGGGGGDAHANRGEWKAKMRKKASQLGYTQRVPPNKAPFDSHGQEVFYNPKTKKYITPDIGTDGTGHNVTDGWKVFNRQGRRTGTYDHDMKTEIKD